MRPRRVLEMAAGAATGAGAAYVLQRAASRRWRVGEEELAASGRTLPPDLRHHFVPVSDGGRIHVVERADRWDAPRADGPTTVLLHGIALGVATWAPLLRRLPGRVVAVSHRGHGQSRAGSEGYAFERLGGDVLEVLDALDVGDATLCGHSMGGMVAQLLAAERGEELARRVRRLVLVATAPSGPAVPPFGAALATGALGRAERRGRGPFPKESTVWLARLNFGAHPNAADVELVRSLLDAMSPAAFAALLPPLVGFDVRDRLGSVALPTHVVVGTRDVQTPLRAGRRIAERVPVAELTVLPGCGHMVMLERTDELHGILA